MTLLKAGNREHRNTLNESPSEKEGKFRKSVRKQTSWHSLNESPSEKEGKSLTRGTTP